MKIGVYAGSFDPITLGHQNIIERALKIVDKLVIGILVNNKKNYWFSLEEREAMIKKIFESYDNIEVKTFSGALVDFMKQENSNILIKGLRNINDFEAEMIYAHANNKFSDGKVETIFLPATTEYSFVSSSFVKEVVIYNLDTENYLNEKIKTMVLERAEKYK